MAYRKIHPYADVRLVFICGEIEAALERWLAGAPRRRVRGGSAQ